MRVRQNHGADVFCLKRQIAILLVGVGSSALIKAAVKQKVESAGLYQMF